MLDELLNSVASFTWDFGMQFYVETQHRNFIFSDPDYNGDGSLAETDQSFEDWISPLFGRDKGKHIIKDYCTGLSKIVLLDGTEYPL